jgi:hypothetical protein
MPYRKGRTLRDLIAPDTRRRNAFLFVCGGMVAGSLLTIGARALVTSFAADETVRYEAAREAVTPVEELDSPTCYLQDNGEAPIAPATSRNDDVYSRY